MKNKALTYILLIVVAAIWYQVFFRVKGNLFGENDTIPEARTEIPTMQFISRDTVDLQLNYRDPFGMEKIKVANSLLEEKPATLPKPKPRPKPQMVWPSIEYYGLVRNTTSTNPLALIKADGIVLNLRKGDEIFNDILLKSITPDSIQIRYKRKVKAIYRK